MFKGMDMKLLRLIALNAAPKGLLWVLTGLLMSGCGAGSSEQAIQLDFQSENDIAPNSLFVSEQPSAGQQDQESELSSYEFQKMLALDPIGQQRCDFPQDETFNEVADALGGFSKPYGIPMARNEALAHFYTGKIPQNWNNYAEDAASVTIERGDLMGKHNGRAFYLAKPHGLMAVSINSEDSSLSEVSCVFSLPGKPLNFYMDQDKIILVINSLGSKHNAAIITLKWQAGKFQFEDALLLSKASVKDSRRFNNSLVLMGNYYLNQAETAMNDNSQGTIPPPYFRPINHLSNVALSNLSLAWQETFNADEHSYYNSFLSATDEYLILSSNTREQVGTKTGHYSYCKTYGAPVSYESCSIKWKKVANPDYVAPNLTGGILACGSDLMACLGQQGPKLSPFIYQPDGQHCQTFTRTSCSAYEYKTYQRAIYQNYTDFRIYRYVSGDFIRLDETMSVLEDNELKLSEHKIRIEGRVQGHEYLQFQSGFFYALSTEGVLTTFTIQGNSIIATASLPGLENNSNITSVEFSQDYILIGKSGGFQAVSLSHPQSPQLSGFISAPGQLNQLIFDENYILGFGSISLDIGGGETNSFEKISLFSLFDGASEVDNYLVGSDLPNTYSRAHYDDQAYQYDQDLNRLFLPLYSYGWMPDKGYVDKNRLAIVDRDQGLLTTPEVLDFPENLERILSMDENHALAFSKSYIHQLNKQGSWQKSQLQKLSIPNKVYSIPESDYWLVYQKNEQGIEIYSNKKDDLFNIPAHARLNIEAAVSNVCFNSRVHLANNLVIQVSEKANLFSSKSDCPLLNSESVLEYLNVRGWKFSELSGFEDIAQQAANAMYLQIISVENEYCVLDTENIKGEKILLSNSHELIDQFTCMGPTEFYRQQDQEI